MSLHDRIKEARKKEGNLNSDDNTWGEPDINVTSSIMALPSLYEKCSKCILY